MILFEYVIKKGYSLDKWKTLDWKGRKEVIAKYRNDKVWRIVYGHGKGKKGKSIEQYKDEDGSTEYTTFDTAQKMHRAMFAHGESIEKEGMLLEKIITKDTLNKNVWTDNKINKNIRLDLLKIAKTFYDGTEIKAPIKDIILTGSLAGYNYTKYSDFDLHILVDFNSIDKNYEIVKMALDGQRAVWNNKHDIKILNHDVEIYLQDINEPHVATGIYSILTDKWVKEPEQETIETDENVVKTKADKIMQQIDVLERNLAMGETPEDYEMVYTKAKSLKDKITTTRQESLKDGGVYSIENLVFKELRNNGYLGKLVTLISTAYDKTYTIEMES